MKNQLSVAVIVALFAPFVSGAQSARTTLLAAETAFAAQAGQCGTAAAFLANTAPAALVTEKGKLASVQDVWTARSSTSNCLLWYPTLADVAQSGDLGYTTGPWKLTQNEQPRTAGEYVTVWRKQSEGQWKFVVSMRIERIGTAFVTPATVAQPRLFAAPATPSRAPSNILLDLDRKFAAAELLKPGATYGQYLSADARLYRPGLSVMQGEAASANMKNLDGGYLFTATTGYLAAAGDLGYVVGTLQRAANGTRHPEETGSYLRIWRRELVAGWQLVLEVFNFVPNPADAVTRPPAKPAATDADGTIGPISTKRG